MIRIDKVIAVFLACSILLSIFPFKIIYADTVAPRVSDNEYVYLDLYYGNITISSSGYSGYVLENGVVTQKTGTIDKKIYIYQSGGDSTIWENGLPKYDRVASPTVNGETWGDYITNNKGNIDTIISNWKKEAGEVDRPTTSNRISITGGNSYDITLDNIWSSYQYANSSRTDGGLSFYANSSTASKAIINLKGDNRFGNVFYATNSYSNHKMIISGDSDATLTVANINTGSSANHFNSAIGGTDSAGGNTKGLVFQNGIIYAGTNYADNCTAIGAGGNATGEITINGGTITAVSNSTGVAIGGGIGYSSYGGDATVTINGGTVYAYNYGYEGIPAAAIGGGSSKASDGNKTTTINIEGGTVYAESVGGTAIGGGGSKTKNGGSATINIGGSATVTAKSVEGTYNGKTINAGASIGGGTGGTDAGKNGGSVNLNVYGNAKIYAGSVGGGKTNNSTGLIGNATITISDEPVIQGQFVMAAGANEPCSFTMNGGSIDNGNKNDDFVFLQENGGAVYVENGNATMNGGSIVNCDTAIDGGAIFVKGGSFIMNSGIIKNNFAANQGGAIAVEDGDVTIGLNTCLGKDETHSHPVISDNVATNKGGAINISGGELYMYCGNLLSNTATKNQSANSVYQDGGYFQIDGGSLGVGVLSDGGEFYDTREASYQIRYHAVYDGVNETVVIPFSSSEALVLPKEDEIENANFSRDGLYLIGWSTSDSNSEGYMVVGNKVFITQDIDFYAVWGDEEPIANFTITIPETIEIDESGVATFKITPQVKYFVDTAKVTVTISDVNGLELEKNNDIKLMYDIKKSNNATRISNGTELVSFSNTNLTPVEFEVELLDEHIYSGKYSDIITFTANYSES